ncbi:ISL3 family transposase [Erysipelothrix sp. HDW6A]|uniref:ISL3 family transposase n=1 Tax=Erysipelothrix sp. HDW6A TaxID=2714928 RepID=UPI00140CCDA2|nr:ISL3 family transposase [Erysipelothrix sp. HDW6A]QIK57045.1 ISL3 family transposase [Erysipelothrix sp. HDW6A]
MDSSNGTVLDILTHRHTGFLKSYFFRYPLKVRKKVETVCIDMFKGYIDVIRVCFPNAVIITDRFHVAQLLNRSLNSVRVQTMNQNKGHYKKLKRYWKLLLKSHEDLDLTNHKKSTGFYHLMTEQQVVDELLRQFPILEESYWLVQNLRSCIKYRNIQRFKTLIEKETRHLPKTIQISMETLRYHSNSIINALTYSNSNGKLEGTNNLIKVIKRITFGYRLFSNFRARILLICNTMLPLQI